MEIKREYIEIVCEISVLLNMKPTAIGDQTVRWHIADGYNVDYGFQFESIELSGEMCGQQVKRAISPIQYYALIGIAEHYMLEFSNEEETARAEGEPYGGAVNGTVRWAGTK